MEPALPPGWSRHKAPSGHYYYYNVTTKKSTYQIPVVEVKEKPELSETHQIKKSPAKEHLPEKPASSTQNGKPKDIPAPRDSKKTPKRPREVPDRPRYKRDVDDSDWSMVFLRSGRWFVHNRQTKQSLWEAPPDLLEKILAMDRDELVVLVAKARGLKLDDEPVRRTIQIVEADEPVERDDEQEEEEEVEEEEEEEDEEEDDEDDEVDADVLNVLDEFDWDNLEEEQAGDNVDKLKQFLTLLDESQVNPYNSWEMEREKVIDDDRYDLLDSTKEREDAFNEWARVKIAEMKSTQPQQETVDQDDDVVEFMQFVRAKYKSKYFYVDFKRKYRNEPAFDVDIADKDKEKLYRGYSLLKKKSESEQVEALRLLLQASNVTSSSDLPESVLHDPRFYVLSDEHRDKVLAEVSADGASKTEDGLAQRQMEIQREKNKQQQERIRERRRLEQERKELDDAKYNVDSRQSYRSIVDSHGK